MAVTVLEPRLSLKCRQCGGVGVPLRVESQTATTIALALRCETCALEWTTRGDLPVFLAWVKRDRRRPS